jgi:hypothetical protein
MRTKLLLFFGFIATTVFVKSQIEGDVKAFNEDFWQEKPILTTLTDEEKKSNAVYLADFNVTSYEYGEFKDPTSGKLIKEILLEKDLKYKRIRLNNDKAIESFNKVYISMSNNRVVTNLKARAINKDGKVIEFDDSNKKEVENYENYGPFTIFALEGIEVGSEVEYTYSTEEPAYGFYYSLNVQGKYPKRNFHYEIKSEENLVFKMKSYNSVPEMTLDTSVKEKVNRYVLHLDKVEKFKEEDYSLNEALKQRIEIKLFENTASRKRNFYSYSEATSKRIKALYDNPNEKEGKKESKTVLKLIKQEKWDKIPNQRDQIIAIEHYLKKEFDFQKFNAFYATEQIEKKVYTEKGCLRVYAKILDALEIKHQLVITCNRFDKTFDEEFETYNYLESYLFYFPKYDQFLAPNNEFMRFGLIPSVLAYNKGLFLRTVEVGGVKSAYPETKKIAGTNSDVNFDNMVADIEFDSEFEKVKAHVKHKTSGYSAAYLRPYMTYIENNDKKDEILEERLKSFADDAEISNIRMKNEELEGYMLATPFEFEGDAESSSLIEKAGKKYLFKIGLVIGTQVEMYQDTARKFPVENSYNHGYKRVLNVKIPEGYKISNLKDINMDFFSSKDGKKTMEFTSKYEIKSDILTITCNEYYDEISVPLDRYEEFRTVINAAADFNKITLVFEEK